MQINNNMQRYSNPAFGKLYMPNREKILRRMGNYAANEADKARPELERLARKYDIFITMKDRSLIYGSFKINVREIPENVIDYLFSKFKLSNAKETVHGYDFYLFSKPDFLKKYDERNYKMSDSMIHKTKRAIRQIENKNKRKAQNSKLEYPTILDRFKSGCKGLIGGCK